MSPSSTHNATVEVDGRTLKLSNLDKPLYPASDGHGPTTKAEVIDYYAKVSPVLLPLLADRPVSRFRWPDGVTKDPFVEKSVPRGTPSWVRTVVVESPGSQRGHERVEYPVCDGLAALTWLANLAALELHVPQWQVGPRGGVHQPDRLVVDLDPGAPAGLPECAQVARLVRERLADDGLSAVPVTSGSKGLQLYAPVSGEQGSDHLREYARLLAESLERDHPDLVVSSMRKTLRPGKVLLDWSQNHHAKTTISPYSLRGRQQPNAACPRTWDELDDDGLAQVRFDAVLDRVRRLGDLAAPLLEVGPRVP